MQNEIYLNKQLRETLSVVDTCLENIYGGKAHMYRPLAVQLRILLCDTARRKDNSLIRAAYPKLKISALRAIEWSPSSAGQLQLEQPVNGMTRMAEMPFELTTYSDGLTVSDLFVDKEKFLPIGDWCNQHLTFHPSTLTCKDVIRTVADKGGGAHVDSIISTDLQFIQQLAPTGQSYGELFVLALGRSVQSLGESLFDYTGVRVSQRLREGTHQKFKLVVLHQQTDTLTK